MTTPIFRRAHALVLAHEFCEDGRGAGRLELSVLASWNEGATKEGGKDYVPPVERMTFGK